MRGSFKREGIYVYISLIHFIVQQKLAQYCKAIIFQWVFIGRTDAEAETPPLWPPHAKS